MLSLSTLHSPRHLSVSMVLNGFSGYDSPHAGIRTRSPTAFIDTDRRGIHYQLNRLLLLFPCFLYYSLRSTSPYARASTRTHEHTHDDLAYLSCTCRRKTNTPRADICRQFVRRICSKARGAWHAIWSSVSSDRFTHPSKFRETSRENLGCCSRVRTSLSST